MKGQVRNNQLNKLTECVHVECSIECDECPEMSANEFLTNEDAAEEFYNEGWRYHSKKVLCPECNKKRQGKKKK